MMRGLVYVLQLENACWYVGWTANPKRRLREHFYKPSVTWLQENRPIDVAHQFYGTLEDETSATLQMAHVYGISQVRGGAYAKNQHYYQERLHKPYRLVIGDEFWLDLVYDDRYLASQVSQQNPSLIIG